MIGDILYSLDVQGLLLAVAFVIIFGLLTLAMGRLRRFQEAPAIKTVIALCISLFAVYGLNRSSFDLEGFFYKVGLSGDLLYNFILVILILFFVLSGITKKENAYGTKKKVWRLYRPLSLLGWILLAASIFTPFIYQKGAGILIGAGLTLLGAFLFWRKRKKWKNYSPSGGGASGGGRGAVGGGPTGPDRKKGIAQLVKAAKIFHQGALKSANPKFYGTWTHFIKYLRDNRWGANEATICKNLGITKRDFVKVFKRYGLIR